MEQAGLRMAGWVVATRTTRPAGLDPLVPDAFWTISHCLADRLLVPEFSGWFQSSREAHELRRDPASVVAVGLYERDASLLVQELDEDWHFLLLRQNRAAPPQPLLGYEIVGAESCLSFHSWHCHGLASEAARELGVGLNEHGLVSSYDDAQRVLDWMLAAPPHEQPAPVPWTVVALWLSTDDDEQEPPCSGLPGD